MFCITSACCLLTVRKTTCKSVITVCFHVHVLPFWTTASISFKPMLQLERMRNFQPWHCIPFSAAVVTVTMATDVCTPDSYNETVTGTDLFCYDCSEIYTKKYDPDDSPCWNNISQIALRQCGERDRYCRVNTLQKFGVKK